ncbi:hypothetical protein [Flavobacterium terrisoli]|uniref:hypothetical protein n=1 Tax=Flavobacterium terrisoli TaxID=3242195 RepID=UPI002542B32C|nr:hypothetical protein [Flavobacterium buctense]
MKDILLLIFILLFFSCKREVKTENLAAKKIANKKIDTISISKTHKVNKIICDLDGDKKNDIVEIVQSTRNKKSGLRIIFGNGKETKYFGMGNDILGQGFDELDWVGIFEKAPKGEVYANNVDENGDILAEDQIKEQDKIKLINDGIFIHAEESCGGGIIYMKNGEFEWIQQE